MGYRAIICFVMGTTFGWFLHYEYEGRYTKTLNKQIAIEKKIDKPIKIVIQRNGRWYNGTEQDIINNR